MNPWFGVLAPAGTPSDILAKLNAELVRSLGSSEIAAQLARQGVETAHCTPGEFSALIGSDLKKWSKVIADAGIKGE